MPLLFDVLERPEDMKTDCKMLPVYVPQELYNEAMLLVARLVKSRKTPKIPRNKKGPAQAAKQIHKPKALSIGCQTDRDLSKQTEELSLKPEVDSLRRELAEAKVKLADAENRNVSIVNEQQTVLRGRDQQIADLNVKIARGKATLSAETQRANSAEQRENELKQQLTQFQKSSRDKPSQVINNYTHTSNVDDRSYIERHNHVHLREGDLGSGTAREHPPSQAMVGDVARGGAITSGVGVTRERDRYIKVVAESNRVSDLLAAKRVSKGALRDAFYKYYAETLEELSWMKSYSPDVEALMASVLHNLTGGEINTIKHILRKYSKYAK